MLKRTCFLTLATVCLLLTNATAAEVQAEPTQKLVAVLQSNAPLFDKARACQQLGEFGDAQAVPALAALLSDEHLSAYARSGLEDIPDPRAAEALRTAAGTLKAISSSA
jgi:HEAT repeat protein